MQVSRSGEATLLLTAILYLLYFTLLHFTIATDVARSVV